MTRRERLEALVKEWEDGDKTALSDYVEGINDERQFCARRIRAILAEPEEPGLREAEPYWRRAILSLELRARTAGITGVSWDMLADMLVDIVARHDSGLEDADLWAPRPDTGSSAPSPAPAEKPRVVFNPEGLPGHPAPASKRWRCLTCGRPVEASTVYATFKGKLMHEESKNGPGCGPVVEASEGGEP